LDFWFENKASGNPGNNNIGKKILLSFFCEGETIFFLFGIRVARFFLVQHTKTGKNIPSYQKYTKWA
jgi:hypothetical protein